MLRPTLRHNQSKARNSTSVTTSTIPIASRRIPTTRNRIAYILMSRYVSFPEPSPTFVLSREGTRTRYGREPESSESGRRQYRQPHSVNGDPTNNERIPKRNLLFITRPCFLRTSHLGDRRRVLRGFVHPLWQLGNLSDQHHNQLPYCNWGGCPVFR